MDLPDPQRLFDVLNRKYFGGRLPRYRVGWSNRLITTAGRIYLGKGAIRLSKAYHTYYPGDIKDTLAHEMIHLWLWSRGRRANHNDEFKTKAQEMGLGSVFAKRIPQEFLVSRGYARRRYLYGFQCPTCGFQYWSPVKSVYVHQACHPDRESLFVRDSTGKPRPRKAVVMRHIGRRLKQALRHERGQP